MHILTNPIIVESLVVLEGFSYDRIGDNAASEGANPPKRNSMCSTGAGPFATPFLPLRGCFVEGPLLDMLL